MRKSLLLFAALLLATSVAYAQGTPNTVELTPTAGYWWGDTIYAGSINNVGSDLTIADSPSYGVRIAYRIAPAFAIEMFLSKEHADLTQGGGGLFGGSNKVGTMDIGVGELNFEWAFGHSRVVPFVVGGFGAMHMSPNINTALAPRNLSSDTRFMGDFGGGMKLFLSPQAALRLDLRWHSVDIGEQHGCDWYDSCGYYHSYNWLTFTEAGLGLSFVF